MPKGGAVAGSERQIKLHWWEWAQEHKPSNSAAIFRQLLSERTLILLRYSGCKREMELSHHLWKQTPGPVPESTDKGEDAGW